MEVGTGSVWFDLSFFSFTLTSWAEEALFFWLCQKAQDAHLSSCNCSFKCKQPYPPVVKLPITFLLMTFACTGHHSVEGLCLFKTKTNCGYVMGLETFMLMCAHTGDFNMFLCSHETE